MIRTAARRAAVVLVVVAGLALMHGGIGPATACDGMAAMPAAPAAPATAAAAVTAVMASAGDASQQQPGHQPTGAHGAQMCVSTPASHDRGATHTGPATPAPALLRSRGGPAHRPTVRRATGREPPAPDLVSVLCVNRR